MRSLSTLVSIPNEVDSQAATSDFGHRLSLGIHFSSMCANIIKDQDILYMYPDENSQPTNSGGGGGWMKCSLSRRWNQD